MERYCNEGIALAATAELVQMVYLVYSFRRRDRPNRPDRPIFLQADDYWIGGSSPPR